MGGSQRVRPAHFFCCCIVRQGFNKNLYPQSAPITGKNKEKHKATQ